LDAINPATNEKITTVRAFTPDEVNECVRRARVAQAEWAETSFDERRAVLQDIMHAVVEQQDTICHLSMQDTGKTRTPPTTTRHTTRHDTTISSAHTCVVCVRWNLRNGG
jgi:acyl-CoA reductase-like NAD-dependent aldehyde dehydrogenase